MFNLFTHCFLLKQETTGPQQAATNTETSSNKRRKQPQQSSNTCNNRCTEMLNLIVLGRSRPKVPMCVAPRCVRDWGGHAKQCFGCFATRDANIASCMFGHGTTCVRQEGRRSPNREIHVRIQCIAINCPLEARPDMHQQRKGV